MIEEAQEDIQTKMVSSSHRGTGVNLKGQCLVLGIVRVCRYTGQASGAAAANAGSQLFARFDLELEQKAEVLKKRTRITWLAGCVGGILEM